jgi:hypothetical protein
MVIKVREKSNPEPEFTATAPATAKKAAEAATHEAKEALVVAQSFPIETAADYEAACEELKKVKNEWANLEARRTEITGPLNAALKSVNDLFRPPLALWKKVEEAIKDRAKPYLLKVREAEEAAERTRQAELAKLNARIEKAEEKGQDAKVADLQGKAAVAASAPSTVVAPQVAGVSSKTKWVYTIVDLRAIVNAAFDGKVAYELTKPEDTSQGWGGDVVITIKVGKLVSAFEGKADIPGIRQLEDLVISSRRG